MADPKPGEMILYDDMLPPLLDNSYRIDVETDVTFDGKPAPLGGTASFFNVEGPRFSLPSNEVAGVFPPRNAHGPFDNSLPHIALLRRTLPWERDLDPQNKIGDPTGMGVPAPAGKVPWMALLLLEEGEYRLIQNQPLEQVVPTDVFKALGTPQNITCDAIEVSLELLESILPSKQELQLLAHVRHVNKDDRELSVEGSDGYFAVVVANRFPNGNVKCRACLVSLEERWDLIAKDPPPVAADFSEIILAPVEPVRINTPAPAAAVNIPGHARIGARLGGIGPVASNPGILKNPILLLSARLVLLTSWQFQTIGTGTYRRLMQDLDVGMIGKLQTPGHPPLTDTFHLQMDLQDRAGVPEQVWYRGPLVPFQLTRDPLGPYHSADQARRATPETGAEDISYAAAFEAGRLIAAADSRLAQELMRWRREAYKQSARSDSVAKVQADLSFAEQIDLHAPVVPVVAASVVGKITTGAGPISDAYGLNKIQQVIGFNPDAVAKAFELPTRDEAVALLGGNAGALGVSVHAPVQTQRAPTTLEAVAADAAGLEHLNEARDKLIANTAIKLGEKL